MSTESWAVAAPQTIDIEGVAGVTLRLQDGRAEVVTAPEATGVRVEVLEIGAKPLQVVRDDTRLRIGYESTWYDSAFARLRSLTTTERAVVRVTVPVGTGVDVGTVEAHTDVTGGRQLSVKTVSGTVRVTGAAGPATLRSVSGDVAVSRHTGDVAVTTVSGATALSGALARVSLSTVSGRSTVTADAGASPMINGKTVSGALDVKLPAGTAVNVKVRGASGQVVLDGSVLPSSGTTLVVDHSEHPAEGSNAAYLSATVTSAHVTIDRR
ncbi:DUF4097 family beta strand repeat-containing protein [Isoptericola sp. NEAU-Y5]|uniref:DUF4097 family beta strand repeat-containing protein n=1 Tax=Isoptericola luteus TaxID=2879484 RepID=A0ABS7ZHW2_9MICO|nr:DUF4097 family beta strand repeat-containing protein [Isoptericola sp. NEAU-Y5]MCA5894615.1 DUF4097 family beta strand repeat-containing protein [Isoptericola sp. NEAU-Y5]